MLTTTVRAQPAGPPRVAAASPARSPGSSAVVLDDADVVRQADGRATLTRALWVVETPVDGTTLLVRSGNRHLQVRLLGVDAPERPSPGQKPSHWAEAAARQLQWLAPRGAHVKLVVDRQAVDEYGRLLAYVVRGRRNVNLELLRSGWAVDYPLYPNLRLLPWMQQATAAAVASGRGIFNPRAPLPLLPYELRQRAQNRPPVHFCGDSRTQRYYTPPEYQRVPVAWRVFFAAEAQAQAFGYAPDDRLAAPIGGLGFERYAGAPPQATQPPSR